MLLKKHVHCFPPNLRIFTCPEVVTTDNMTPSVQNWYRKNISQREILIGKDMLNIKHMSFVMCRLRWRMCGCLYVSVVGRANQGAACGASS